ncbi:unnamed protein product, partial [Rotaria sordida]
SFPRHVHDMKTNVILQDKTNEFMQNFAWRTFFKLEPRHIEILRMNSATVAFTRVKDNDYMVATKLHDISGFIRKLFAKNNQYSQFEQSHLKMNIPSNNK